MKLILSDAHQKHCCTYRIGSSHYLLKNNNKIERTSVYNPETHVEPPARRDAGSTSFSARVPDTVTEWVGEAVCVNPELGLGLSPPTTLTVFTPFFLDLTTPPSVRRQERVPLRVSVFNYLDQTLPVRVRLARESHGPRGVARVLALSTASVNGLKE